MLSVHVAIKLFCSSFSSRQYFEILMSAMLAMLVLIVTTAMVDFFRQLSWSIPGSTDTLQGLYQCSRNPISNNSSNGVLVLQHFSELQLADEDLPQLATQMFGMTSTQWARQLRV